MNYKFILSEHGFMFPDYFEGTSGIQLNVYPLKHHTKGEVIEMLKEEIDLCYDSIRYVFFKSSDVNEANIDKKLELLYSELESQVDLDSQFSDKAPSEEEMEEEDYGEYPPYIFSLEIEFFE